MFVLLHQSLKIISRSATFFRSWVFHNHAKSGQCLVVLCDKIWQNNGKNRLRYGSQLEILVLGFHVPRHIYECAVAAWADT